jgi:hypothetical protein
MVPIPGIEVPLEKMNTKYGKKETDNYLDQIASFCINTASKIKQAMDKQPVIKKAEPVKKVSTENW